MGRDAVVGHGLHFLGADLDLDGHAMHAEQGGVQRLVAIGLGNRNVVLEAAGHGLVEIVHGAEHAVAGVDLVHHDAERVHVHDLGEGLALGAHLLVDAVQVFFPAEDPPGHAFTQQAGFERCLDLLDDFLAVAADAFHGGIDATGAHGVERVEAQLFEFDAD